MSTRGSLRGIESFLLQDLGYKEIASRLRITKNNVSQSAERIYKRHGLGRKSGKQALAKKLGVELPNTAIATEFRERLLSGQSIDEISQAMDLTRIAVSSRCKKIFKQEEVSGRKGFFAKYASNLPSCSLSR